MYNMELSGEKVVFGPEDAPLRDLVELADKSPVHVGEVYKRVSQALGRLEVDRSLGDGTNETLVAIRLLRDTQNQLLPVAKNL